MSKQTIMDRRVATYVPVEVKDFITSEARRLSVSESEILRRIVITWYWHSEPDVRCEVTYGNST